MIIITLVFHSFLTSLVLLFPSPPAPLSILWWPRALITIGIIITLVFHSFLTSLARSKYLSLLFIFFQFYSVVSRDSKVHNFDCSLFLLIIIRSGRLAEIRWSVWKSKSQRSFCLSFLFALHLWASPLFIIFTYQTLKNEEILAQSMYTIVTISLCRSSSAISFIS